MEVTHPQVLIAPEAYTRMRLFCAEAGGDEVGLMGTVTRTNEGDGVLYVMQVFCYRQEVGAVSTDAEPEAIAEFLERVHEEAGVEPGDLRCWLHKHPGMSTTWSGTDEETIASFRSEWMLHVCMSENAQALNVRLELYDSDHHPAISLDGLSWQIGRPPSEAEVEAVKAEFGRYVTRRRVKVQRWSPRKAWKRGSRRGERQHPDLARLLDTSIAEMTAEEFAEYEDYLYGKYDVLLDSLPDDARSDNALQKREEDDD